MQKKHLLIISFIILICISYLFPHGFWPFSQIALYSPLFQIFIFLILSLSILLPKFDSKIFKLNTKIAYPSIFLGSFAILYFFFQHNSLTGDTVQIFDKIKNFPTVIDWEQNRAISIAVFASFAKLLSNLTDTWTATAMFHMLIGALWAVSVYILSAIFTEKHRLVLSLTIICGALLIFDHIEVYALPMLFQSIFFIVLFKYKGKKGLILSLAAALIAGLLHPILLYLIVIAIAKFYFEKGGKWLTALIVISFGILLLFTIDYKWDFSSKQNIFLAISEPDYFLSFAHIKMVFSYFFAIGPALLFLFFGKFKKLPSTLLISSFASLMIIILLDYKFAGADRDLAIMILFPVLLSGALSATKAELEQTALQLSLIFILIALPLRLSTSLEIERSEQLLLNQQTPYLVNEFPANSLIGFRLSQDIARTENLDLLPHIVDNSLDAIFQYPGDRRAYVYLAAAFGQQDNFKMSAATVLLGAWRANNNKTFIKSMLKTQIRAGNDKYFPFGFPSPLTEQDLESIIKPSTETINVQLAKLGTSMDKDGDHVFQGKNGEIIIKTYGAHIIAMTSLVENPFITIDVFLPFAWQRNKKIYPPMIFYYEEAIYLGVTFNNPKGFTQIIHKIDKMIPSLQKDLGKFQIPNKHQAL